jgi:hypothetical protein
MITLYSQSELNLISQAEEYDAKYAPLPKIASGSCDKSIKIWEYHDGLERLFED